MHFLFSFLILSATTLKVENSVVDSWAIYETDENFPASVCESKDDDYEWISCEIGSFFSSELIRKKVHFFRRPSVQKIKLEANIDSDVLERIQSSLNTRTTVDNPGKSDHCQTDDASNVPLLKAFIHVQNEVSNEYSEKQGKTFHEVDLFFHRNGDKYNFQYRARNVCSPSALKIGCTQRYKRTRALISHALTFEDPSKYHNLFGDASLEDEYTNGNRQKRGIGYRAELSLPAIETPEFEMDHWMLNDNWLLNMLSEMPSGGENLQFSHASSYPGKTPLYSFPNKYLNHHHDDRSLPGNIYVSEADTLIPDGCGIVEEHEIESMAKLKRRICLLDHTFCKDNYAQIDHQLWTRSLFNQEDQISILRMHSEG